LQLDFLLDSCNENLPEKDIHRNYARDYASARAACRAGVFVARAARAAAHGGFLVFAEKTGKYRGSRN